jgi:hypothetical protein
MFWCLKDATELRVNLGQRLLTPRGRHCISIGIIFHLKNRKRLAHKAPCFDRSFTKKTNFADLVLSLILLKEYLADRRWTAIGGCSYE